MKTLPKLPTPTACQAEAQHIITNGNEIVAWLKDHRREHHPTEPSLKRIILVCDHGPEWAPLLAFAGQEPPSPEYVSDLLAQAWNVMTEQRTIN